MACRPLDYLEQCGWLNARTWLAHGIHFNAAEMKRLGKAGNHDQPLRLQQPASGIRLLSGLRHGRGGGLDRLGVDGSASNDKSNLMQEVRAAFLLQACALWRRPRQPQGTRFAGRRGIGGLRRPPELGEIAVGRAADLALFKLDELRFSGHGDPLAALVLCGPIARTG